MRDVDATIRSPAFRAWHNALRIPSGIDHDELLAAGVIADNEDWQLWTAHGWFAFMMRDSVTDAQQVALFGIVQAGLKRSAHTARDLSSLTYGDVLEAQASDRPLLIARGTRIVCPAGHPVARTKVDLYGANPAAGLRGDKLCAASLQMAPDQPAFADADTANGKLGSLSRCHCGEPWGWYGSLLTESGWVPPLTERAESRLATKRQLITRDQGQSA